MCTGLTVFAGSATVSSVPGTQTIEVKGQYQSGTPASTVYKVDISWGDMLFTYTAGSQGTWNPQTHSFDNATQGSWSSASGSNVITVTNHSNAAVTAGFSYTPGSSYSGITGTFSKSSINLASAVNTQPTAAPSDSTSLTLSGTLSSSVTSPTSIGTITVSLS